MPSSISSSDADPVDLRPVPEQTWPRVALVAFALAGLSFVGWELGWRSEGYVPSYENSDGQWAEARRKVDRDDPKATVLIGSSRMQFDIDLDVWREATGVEPIQLALEGSNPLPVLEQLAADEDLDGLLLVGITPPLILMPGIGVREGALERYQNETPAQWIGQQLSYPLEARLASYSWDTALFRVLNRQPWWPEREGFEAPPPDVRKIENMRRNRQADLWSRVETDTAFNRVVTTTWQAFLEAAPPPPPEDVARKQFEELLQRVAGQVEQIRRRGGEVVFVRLPSSGWFREFEAEATPRDRIWEPLIAAADVVGVHFEDYPALQVPTPEWSHISARHKADFTHALVDIIRDRLSERGVQRPELVP